MDLIYEMSKTEYVYFSVDEMLEKFKKMISLDSESQGLFAVISFKNRFSCANKIFAAIIIYPKIFSNFY